MDSLRAAHKAAHAETVQRYTQAQKDAQRAFDAQIAIFQAQNRRLNDAADKKVADTTIVYRDRVIRLPTAAATCYPDSAEVSATGVPVSPDRPRAEAELSGRVVIKRDDVLICAANQARLEAAHTWALEMQESFKPDGGIK
ncbi:hypothetical protein M2336_001647 [Sphingobium sp. B1D7B]|uniref:hypothetical protein n=1 Tax=Sphingobium sp. B1D7B TaxID=2940578 RepID=UPI00222498AB|nr:hypothetical protein [Sphingobium sp. B1D7B]MCW2405018.1 hypothetical protein [Sphingobium sp. B1D7B]